MNISFSEHAWEEYNYWVETDKKMIKKINELIEDIARNSFLGRGKPEPLKHDFAGFWSRRITSENRIIYKVERRSFKIVQLRYHY